MDIQESDSRILPTAEDVNSDLNMLDKPVLNESKKQKAYLLLLLIIPMIRVSM